MSEEAKREFRNARSAQLQRNEARNMRKLVSVARGEIHRSGNRWPFELTQNAHDPGPRIGRTAVNISLSFDGKTVIYEHDGKPFSMRDLAALLSGGSNKDFESVDTTGRFGTGFLLTHVLAHQIDFTGILEAGNTHEKVEIHLDRSGNDDEIYANTIASEESIDRAVKIDKLDGQKSAQFRYQTDNPAAAKLGLEYFSKVLPYLYGTCENLGQVHVRAEDGKSVEFQPEPEVPLVAYGLQIRRRDVIVSKAGEPNVTFRSLRLRKAKDSKSSLVILLEKADSTWRVVSSPADFPKFFCRFPIRASDFLPVNVVIDGRFDLSVERDSIMMNDTDKAQIIEALGLLPALVEMAVKEDWMDGFKLARLGMPKLVFGDPLVDADKQWWKAALSAVAGSLSRMEIVRTANGDLHKIDDPESCADFVIPRFDVTQQNDELEFKEVWNSARTLEACLPPQLEIAPEWTQITREWQSIDIHSQRMTLSAIADLARKGVSKLEELKTSVPQLEWLAHFLNLVGQLVKKHNCAAIVSGLIPNQNDDLCPHDKLKRDIDIEKTLKDIAGRINLDIRARLLSKDLGVCGSRPELNGLKTLLETLVAQTLTSNDVKDECIQELSKQLPDFRPVPSEKQVFRDASMDFLLFLWNTQGDEAADLARKCPLIAVDGTAVRWSPQRKMMSPVSYWHIDAQPFAKVYKDDRILAEDYLTRYSGDKTLVQALVAWDMAFPDPLGKDKPKEMPPERLKPILVPGQGEGIMMGEIELSQIALLPTELIQRCRDNQEMAKLLLGLVLKYVARQDNNWLNSVPVTARASRETLTVNIFPALWIADLKCKSWVPLRVEAGWSNVLADAGTLKELLDPAWLEGNDAGIRLLAKFFGYKELELRLLATAPSEELRQQMESGLAKIVQTLGADASQYTELATALVEKKRRDQEKERNRKFGFAVQDAIKKCLELQNLNLTLVDCGYDYDVYFEKEEPIEAATLTLKLADYLLEVKATTTGEVRLTPKQAQTASESPDKFVLCVVDLRGITHERMVAEWTAADVEPKTKFIIGVGKLVDQPHGLVEEAKDCPVGIRNDNALRYGVPVSIWEAGMSASDWTGNLAKINQTKNEIIT